jgi:chromosome segregation ATPase
VTTYRGLGFDPTPGRLDAVAHTVDQLTAVAEAFESVEPALRAAERRSRSWEGAAAEAFRARLRDAPDPRVARASIAVLDRWARTLAANQRQAEELDAVAVRLRRQLSDAQDALQDKQNALDLASTASAVASASVAVSAATSQVGSLESELGRVLDRARTLERDHRRAADEVAAELAALRGGEVAQPRVDRPAIRALAGVLGRASGLSAGLAGLLTPGAVSSVPSGAGAALSAALSSPPPPSSGELIVFELS